MKMKKSTALIPLLLLSFLGFKAWSQEQVIDEVVAVVGANYILQSDIESQYIQFRMQGGITDARATRCQILEDLLFQKLMLNQAELDSIQVTEEQIEQTMDARFRYYIQQFGSQEKLEQFYKKSLIEIKEEFRTLVKDQLMVDEAQQNIIKDLKVTPSEVRSFFNNLPKDSIPMIEMEYEIGQIVKEPSINKDELDATKARLKSLRDRILNGESFNTLAVLYSEDPGSAKKSGEVGFVSRGQLYPEYEAAAFGLKKGEVSEIIKSKAGYHIIQLIERRGEQINTRHILLIPKVSDADIQKASKLLDSIADLIREKKMTFEEAALQFSDDPGKINGASMVNPTTGNTRFVAGQIDPKVFFSIEKLNPGEISRPVVKVNEEEKKTVSLFYLKSRTEPHRANLKDDYSTIMEWAMNKKRGEVLNKWIADKISKTYFRINESYLDCNFQHSWEVKQY
ncbi:MAG: peptidylprolyl isomerase [Bacteroidetes bacterium HGW-Bacteroidetes-9]|jgi:peptidyl-prolyl cis-trans isomerase SurA|nr:MAG: peptidylprolyl isomerase [Bacteroidetes bacterium HGW-Bacteroidetes-9]